MKNMEKKMCIRDSALFVEGKNRVPSPVRNKKAYKRHEKHKNLNY